MSDLNVTGGEAPTIEEETEYTGTITNLELRDTDDWGTYLDVIVNYDNFDTEDTPSYSFPDEDETLTPNMDLGKLLERFGITIRAGDTYDINEILNGEPVVFETDARETEDDYINIDKHTLRPAPGTNTNESTSTSTSTNSTNQQESADNNGVPSYEDLAQDIDSRMLPASKGEVMREFAQHNGEYVQRFKNEYESNVWMVDDGQILTYQPQNQ